MTSKRDEDLRNAGTFTALFGIVVLALGLLLLVALVFPSALAVLVLLAIVPLVFGIHYVLWGWSLARTPPPEEEDER